jgi:hypothetical protein
MYYAPVSGSPGFRRRMQNKRTHDQCVASGDDASFWRCRCHGLINFVLRKDTESMGGGDNAQTPPLLVCIVNVQANRHHLIQYRERWLDVINPVLIRPRPPAWYFESAV